LRLALAGIAVSMIAIGCSVSSKVSSSGPEIASESPQATKSESFPDVTGVQAGDVYTVDVSIGTKPGVSIEAPKDLLPHLTSKVENGVLLLGSDTPFSLTGNQKILAHVVVSKLTYAAISGAGTMTVKDSVSGTSLKAEASGASKLNFSANVDDLSLNASGSSQVDLGQLNSKSAEIELDGASRLTAKGKLDSLKVQASGSSNFECSGLAAKKAECSASGASQINVQAIDTLKASASGSSNIKYQGNPKVDQDTSGVSSVSKA